MNQQENGTLYRVLVKSGFEVDLMPILEIRFLAPPTLGEILLIPSELSPRFIAQPDEKPVPDPRFLGGKVKLVTDNNVAKLKITAIGHWSCCDAPWAVLPKCVVVEGESKLIARDEELLYDDYDHPDYGKPAFVEKARHANTSSLESNWMIRKAVFAKALAILDGEDTTAWTLSPDAGNMSTHGLLEDECNTVMS